MELLYSEVRREKREKRRKGKGRAGRRREVTHACNSISVIAASHVWLMPIGEKGKGKGKEETYKTAITITNKRTTKTEKPKQFHACVLHRNNDKRRNGKAWRNPEKERIRKT